MEAYEVAIDESVLDDLTARIHATRWPRQPPGITWEHGMDFAYLQELCEYWADEYDWSSTERALNALANWRTDGVHFIRERAERGDGMPIILIHGWPGAPIEFRELIPLLVGAGHDVVVPSLPGFAFSDVPDAPLNVAGISARLRGLMAEIGYKRYAVQGGDWGSIIGARMAFEAPDAVAALHLNTPGVVPPPASFDDPPMTDAEMQYGVSLQKWLTRGAFHLLAQGAASDALAPAFNDSPAGLAAWLVDKYRRWSDCDGVVERRFSKDDICDLLTTYWATETITSSMRTYAAEARDRWRFASGERVAVPTAVADFPAEITRPPREWVGRSFSDLRRWTTFDRGGHFAAFEEPGLLAEDINAFLAEL